MKHSSKDTFDGTCRHCGRQMRIFVAGIAEKFDASVANNEFMTKNQELGLTVPHTAIEVRLYCKCKAPVLSEKDVALLTLYTGQPSFRTVKAVTIPKLKTPMAQQSVGGRCKNCGDPLTFAFKFLLELDNEEFEKAIQKWDEPDLCGLLIVDRHRKQQEAEHNQMFGDMPATDENGGVAPAPAPTQPGASPIEKELNPEPKKEKKDPLVERMKALGVQGMDMPQQIEEERKEKVNDILDKLNLPLHTFWVNGCKDATAADIMAVVPFCHCGNPKCSDEDCDTLITIAKGVVK
jgi:hypothetical protein